MVAQVLHTSCGHAIELQRPLPLGLRGSGTAPRGKGLNLRHTRQFALLRVGSLHVDVTISSTYDAAGKVVDEQVGTRPVSKSPC
jgi:hypothetical protein